MLKSIAIATLVFSGTVAATTLPTYALGTYNFDGDSTVATSVNSNVTFSNFGNGGSTITPNASGFSSGNPMTGKAINYQAWATTATIDLTKYYAFTISPNAGIQISLTNLVFDAQRSATGPATLAVRSSIDGYAANLSTLTPGNGTFTTGLSTALTGTQFQNLTSNVTFRIYGYGATASTGSLRVDNAVLNGTASPIVPVPFGFTPALGMIVNVAVFQLRKWVRISRLGTQQVT